MGGRQRDILGRLPNHHKTNTDKKKIILKKKPSIHTYGQCTVSSQETKSTVPSTAYSHEMHLNELGEDVISKPLHGHHHSVLSGIQWSNQRKNKTKQFVCQGLKLPTVLIRNTDIHSNFVREGSFFRWWVCELWLPLPAVFLRLASRSGPLSIVSHATCKTKLALL